MNHNRTIRLLSVAFVALIVVSLAWFIYDYARHRGMISVQISVVPEDSKLKIDSKLSSPGKVYLKPGKHILEAIRTDFDPDVKQINTADIFPKEIIYMLPAANSAAAKSWLLQHPDVQSAREAAGGSESNRIQQVLIKKYPILADLPVETLHYKIDYSIDSSQKVSLTITLFGILNRPSEYPAYVEQLKQYKSEALKYLSDHKTNSSDFKITYVPDAPQ